MEDTQLANYIISKPENEVASNSEDDAISNPENETQLDTENVKPKSFKQIWCANKQCRKYTDNVDEEIHYRKFLKAKCACCASKKSSFCKETVDEVSTPQTTIMKGELSLDQTPLDQANPQEHQEVKPKKERKKRTKKEEKKEETLDMFVNVKNLPDFMQKMILAYNQ